MNIRRRSLTLTALLTLALLAAGSGAQTAAPSVPAPELQPDLRTTPLDDVYIDTSDGSRLLRLSNEIVNQGLGPMELEPRAEDCNGNGDTTDDRTAYQIVYQDTNGDGLFTRGQDTKSSEKRAGCMLFHPAHNHWHFQDFAVYQLLAYQPDGSLGPVVRESSKTSYCIRDGMRWTPDLQGAPGYRYYPVGTSNCTQDSVMGLSVSWTDRYYAGIADQDIDIGDLPDGTYCLSSTVDPDNQLVESNHGNNTARLKITIEGNDVTWLPRTPCLPGDLVNEPVTSGPPVRTTATDATFTFEYDDLGRSYECALETEQWHACGSPVTFSDIPPGYHFLSVRSVDPSGVLPPGPTWVWRWTISADPTPANDDFANATVISGPVGTLTSDSTGATVERGEPRNVDNDGGWSVWYSWRAPASGTATFDLTDSSFDTTLGIYSGATLDTLQRLAEDDDGGTSLGASKLALPVTGGKIYRLHVDGYFGSSLGTGTSGPFQLAWTAPPDVTPPETTIDGGPSASTTSTDAAFAFSADEPATFDCSLGASDFAPCTSPQDYSGLTPGGYSFRVRATDTAGNVDGTPATRVWTVVSPPPASPPPPPDFVPTPPATSPPPPIPPAKTPPGCVVPGVRGDTLTAARRAILAAHCRVGAIRYARSKTRKGHVVSQRPAPRLRVARLAHVTLVVSRGPRPLKR
jgi:hypothetical protein